VISSQVPRPANGLVGLTESVILPQQFSFFRPTQAIGGRQVVVSSFLPSFSLIHLEIPDRSQ